MKLSLSAVLDHLGDWQRKATEVQGLMLGYSSQAWVIKFHARVSVHDKGIMLSDEKGFELSVILSPQMTFIYTKARLEIQASDWGCRLYPKSKRIR